MSQSGRKTPPTPHSTAGPAFPSSSQVTQEQKVKVSRMLPHCRRIVLHTTIVCTVMMTVSCQPDSREYLRDSPDLLESLLHADPYVQSNTGMLQTCASDTVSDECLRHLTRQLSDSIAQRFSKYCKQCVTPDYGRHMITIEQRQPMSSDGPILYYKGSVRLYAYGYGGHSVMPLVVASVTWKEKEGDLLYRIGERDDSRRLARFVTDIRHAVEGAASAPSGNLPSRDLRENGT